MTIPIRNFFAVVWDELLLRPYLEGFRFQIWTDHDVHAWGFDLANGSGKFSSGCLRLSHFTFDLVHHHPVKHQSADTLLRLLTDGQDATELKQVVLVLKIVLAGEARIVKPHAEEYSILDVALQVIGKELPAVFAILTALTLRMEPTKATFLP